MKKKHYLWTVKVNYSTGEEMEDVYSLISEVKRFIHLLVCAGYNEQHIIGADLACDASYSRWLRVKPDAESIEVIIDRKLCNCNTLTRLI